MCSAPVRGNALPPSDRFPSPPPQNPTLQTAIIAPQLNNVGAPEDPRGRKRVRPEGELDSEVPVLKQARTEAVAEPVAEPVDPNQQALMNAIEAGDLEGVKRLIGSFPTLLQQWLPGISGMTPLCLATQRGQKDIAIVLVSAGAVVNGAARCGATPLMLAASNGYLDLIDLFSSIGGDIHAISHVTGVDALFAAVTRTNLDACKLLILKGADLQRKLTVKFEGNPKPVILTPLLKAISSGFSDLIAWWLDSKKQSTDTVEESTGRTIFHCAALEGKNAIAVVRILVERGELLDGPLSSRCGKYFPSVWEFAALEQNYALIEYLLDLGRLPKYEARPIPAFSKLSASTGPATDLCIHLPRTCNPKAPADCLAEDHCRQHPEESIKDFVRHSPFSSGAKFAEAIVWWTGKLWLGSLVSPASNDTVMACAQILGQNEQFNWPLEKLDGPAVAQQLQILVECLSLSICTPTFPTRFTDYGLTRHGAGKMNHIAIAQGALLLKGIDVLRKRFGEQVATLPDICISTYISLSHQVNEPDLYRKMTREWGLYDPIARAVLRLVKETYQTLQDLQPEKSASEFIALSPEEQLRLVIAHKLEEWDKIPEIVETLMTLKNPLEMECVSELLFQQWRLFCEAFGVTKPRYSRFGPIQQLTGYPETEAHAVPVMEVDDAPRVGVAASISKV